MGGCLVGWSCSVLLELFFVVRQKFTVWCVNQNYAEALHGGVSITYHLVSWRAQGGQLPSWFKICCTVFRIRSSSHTSKGFPRAPANSPHGLWLSPLDHTGFICYPYDAVKTRTVIRWSTLIHLCYYDILESFHRIMCFKDTHFISSFNLWDISTL